MSRNRLRRAGFVKGLAGFVAFAFCAALLAAALGQPAVKAAPVPEEGVQGIDQSITMVINEIDYDQPATDIAEFIELKNISAGTVNLGGWSLQLMNGANNTIYNTISLPSVTVPAGGFYVICGNATFTCPCHLDVTPDTNLIQNGSPDAMNLMDNNGRVIDAVAYEGIGTLPTSFFETSSAGTDNATGGVGGGNDFKGLSRVPDGADTDNGANDFDFVCITPGAANTTANTGCTDPCLVIPPNPPPVPDLAFNILLPRESPADVVEPINSEDDSAPSLAAELGGSSILNADLKLGPAAGILQGPALGDIPTGIRIVDGVPDPCYDGAVAAELTITELGGGPVPDLSSNETVIDWGNSVLIERCDVLSPDMGTCTVTGNTTSFDYALATSGTFEARFVFRFVGGIGFNDTISGAICLNWDGLVTGLPDGTFSPLDDQRCGQLGPAKVVCGSLVDPNRQLGCQVHLPILNFQGQDDVCRSWIETQYVGCEPSKAVLVTWGEPGFCPPQAAGPLKVECTGLLAPGSTWNLLGAQIPSGSKSGILFKFTARQASEIPGVQLRRLDVELGFDDVVADLMCETLFFGIVGDSDDYRRFKKAYDESLVFAGIPMEHAAGSGVLAVEVLRHCPGDVTPGVEVSSKYNGIAGAHLGFYDPIFGGYGYYVPLVYAGKAGLNTVMYIQNGGLQCSSVEIWFKAQDDCLRARICEIFALAPGETYQWDASDCVGPDWQGSAWIRASVRMGIAVDIYGRDILMTYIGEPQPFNYVMEDGSGASTVRTGEKVAFGPLIYSEYQGWDSGVQVMNLSEIHNAKVKVYFLDRSGDIITTLVDWVCPRGSQTFFLPIVASLPGSWVGSIRVESQNWWTPGVLEVTAPDIVAVAQLMKYSDVARSATTEAIAYNLLPEHKSYVWQVGFAGGGRASGVGLLAVPSLLKDLDNTGTTSELAIMNLVTKPGFTDFAIYIFDQNGLLDFVCQKLHREQVEYIDLQTWGYVNNGFKGSAVISATFWEHDVFSPNGNFLRNLVGLGAVSIERSGTRLGEDIPGDEAAGSRAIPFAEDERLSVCFGGFKPSCPGQPAAKPVDGACGLLVINGEGGAIPTGGGGDSFTEDGIVDFFGDCEVTDVDLFLDITHPFAADLDIFLSHNNVTQEMFTDVCGGDDDVLVTLDDDDPLGQGAMGFGTSCNGTGPAGQGSIYTTESGIGLDQFDGLSAAGDWTLNVTDDFVNDDGFINAWTLSIQTRER